MATQPAARSTGWLSNATRANGLAPIVELSVPSAPKITMHTLAKTATNAT